MGEEGVQFIVRFPALLKQKDREEAGAEPAEDLGNQRILVVDDEPLITELLEGG